MKKSKLLFIGSLLILVAASFLLITGSSLLVKSISEDPYIPMGTIITWLGMISLPLSIYFGVGKLRNPSHLKDKITASVLKVLIVLATLWGPICYLLAGNFSFSFTEKAAFQGGQTAMKLFWYFNYAVVVMPIALLILYGIFSLFRNKEQSQ